MKRALACLSLACFACGEAVEATPTLVLEEPPPPPVVQEPTEPALLKQAREARGSGYAERYQASASASPARHYFFGGKARFDFRDPAREAQSFDFDVALASPSLQRFQLTTGEWKNWFLLGGPGDAWVKTPNDLAPRPYSAGAGELGEDAGLRWLILGFPAALDRVDTEAQAEQWSELWSQGKPIPLAEDLGQGNLQLWLDAESGLPTRVERKQAEGEAQLLLSVSDWSYSYEGIKGERFYPQRWEWQREDWVLIETIEALEDCALYLDTAFRPKEAPLSEFQVRRGSDGSTQRVPDERFALVSYSMRYRVIDQRPDADTARIWELRDAKGSRFIQQLDDAAEGEAVERVDEQLCLLWSTSQATSFDAKADARIREIAAENGFEVIGPVWIHTEVAGFEVLLPVRQPD